MHEKKYLKTIRGGSYLNYISMAAVKARLYDHNGDRDPDTSFRIIVRC